MTVTDLFMALAEVPQAGNALLEKAVPTLVLASLPLGISPDDGCMFVICSAAF
jgi:hypothetical protein